MNSDNRVRSYDIEVCLSITIGNNARVYNCFALSRAGNDVYNAAHDISMDMLFYML